MAHSRLKRTKRDLHIPQTAEYGWRQENMYQYTPVTERVTAGLMKCTYIDTL